MGHTPRAIDLLEFISEYESVNRFSRNHLVRPETLVQHVGVVSIICAYLINRMTEYYDKELFTSQECCSIMMRAVVHDMDEIITGDVIRPTKYANDKIEVLLKDLAASSVPKVIEKFDLPARWEEDWRQSKRDVTGLILKVADAAAVVMTCYREVTLFSNNQFLKVATECMWYLEELQGVLGKTQTRRGEIKEYLIDFVSQLQYILKGVGNGATKAQR